MEPGDVIWEGKIGDTTLRVGVPHAAMIISEWDSPRGSRHKVADSYEEFERAVLFQLLLGAGETDETATQEVAAIFVVVISRKRPPAPCILHPESS